MKVTSITVQLTFPRRPSVEVELPVDKDGFAVLVLQSYHSDWFVEAVLGKHVEFEQATRYPLRVVDKR